MVVMYLVHTLEEQQKKGKKSKQQRKDKAKRGEEKKTTVHIYICMYIVMYNNKIGTHHALGPPPSVHDRGPAEPLNPCLVVRTT